MPTITEINSQIKKYELGNQLFQGTREIMELPNILMNDESVENIILGTYGKGNGILVATGRRLVFVDKVMLWGLRVEDFPYEKITSVQYETGLLVAKLIIFASGNKAIIQNVSNVRAREFGEWVRAKISGPPKSAPINSNTIDQLERLMKLKEQGALTDEEYNEQKKIILSK